MGEATKESPQLARRVGLFDATMLVIGGIVGAGIFINPYVVANAVHTPVLILGAWVLGGLIALAGAFVYAGLSARRPEVGGQYAFFREAFHPAVAFLYGWALLLVIQTGGMAAVAITFAKYFVRLTHLPLADWLVASAALGVLTVINCLGVRAGTTVQSTLTVLKILAIGGLIVCGLVLIKEPHSAMAPILEGPASFGLLTEIGAAMVPVLFAYGGWQTACFLAGEVRDPAKNLPRGLLFGVLGVIALYLAVNFVCVRGFGAAGLARTATPASDLMKLVLGERGAALIAIGIVISTLGFLSQGMLTAPRVYFAMAEDRLFFRSIGRLHPRTRVPVAAIALQGVASIIIAVSGHYEQILNYVVSVDFIFYGLTATCVFVFRSRERSRNTPPNPDRAALPRCRVAGHPWTTLFFIVACWLVVLNTVCKYPANSLIGVAILLAGIPVYFCWQRQDSTK